MVADEIRHKSKTCSICDEEFSSPQALKCHERVHKGEKPYWCAKCEMGFDSWEKLKLHRQTHTGKNNILAASVVNFLQVADICQNTKEFTLGKNLITAQNVKINFQIQVT